jgi:hypothetical protein
VVAGAAREDLSLVFKPSETAAVNNAVTVSLKRAAQRMLLFRIVPSQRFGTEGGKRFQKFFFLLFYGSAYHGGGCL